MKELAVVLLLLLLTPATVEAASDRVLRAEAERYVVTPCLRAIVRSEGMSEYVSEDDAIEMLRTMNSDSWDETVEMTVDITRKLPELKKRKTFYRIAKQTCIKAGVK